MPISQRSVLPAVAAEAALSFLKDTKGALTWSAKDVSDVLKIPKREAERVIPLLEAQGYAQRTHQPGEWMTTPAGESVSGAKPPRFTRDTVEQAVIALQDRIQEANKNAKGPYKITHAVGVRRFRVERTSEGANCGCGHRIGETRRERRRAPVRRGCKTGARALSEAASWQYRAAADPPLCGMDEQTLASEAALIRALESLCEKERRFVSRGS